MTIKRILAFRLPRLTSPLDSRAWNWLWRYAESIAYIDCVLFDHKDWQAYSNLSFQLSSQCTHSSDIGSGSTSTTNDRIVNLRLPINGIISRPKMTPPNLQPFTNSLLHGRVRMLNPRGQIKVLFLYQLSEFCHLFWQLCWQINNEAFFSTKIPDQFRQLSN
jgi:hypothetical protein